MLLQARQGELDQAASSARVPETLRETAAARTLSPHARLVRFPEFGCDVVEVVLSFALNLGDVTRF